jgi:hypothetical protein
VRQSREAKPDAIGLKSRKKSQTPMFKRQKSVEIQNLKTTRYFEICALGFLWRLEFWDLEFRESDST